MENRAYAIATGVFVLLLGLGMAAAVAWFNGAQGERVRYTVVSETGVPGLNLKAAVKLRGIEVGKVEVIGFDSEDPRRILVTIAVDPAAPVATTTTAQLALQGVTGMSFIALDEESVGTPLVRATPGARIALRASLLDRLSATAPAAVAGFNETAVRLNAVLSDANREELARTLAQVNVTAAEAQRLLAALQPGAKALPELLRSAQATVQTAQGTLQRIDQVARDSQSLVNDVRGKLAVMDTLDDTAKQLATSARNLEMSLVGVSSPSTRPMMDDVAAASRSLERTVGQLGDDPSSILFGRGATPPGPGESGFEARLRGAR